MAHTVEGTSDGPADDSSEDGIQDSSPESPDSRVPIKSEELSAMLGEMLCRARKRKQMTRAEVAKAVQMSVEFYSRIERGNALPSVRRFSRLVEVLDVSADELLGFTDAEANEPPWKKFHLPDDSPEVRQIIRRVRMGNPKTLSLLDLLVRELNQIGPEIRSDDVGDDAADDPTGADE